MKLVTPDEMRAIEREADQAGYSYTNMMEQAGSGVAQVIRRVISDPENRTAVALVGVGNNGGDALVALADLAGSGWSVSAWLIKPRDGDPWVERVKRAGGKIITFADDPYFYTLDVWLEQCNVVVDGVLGTGVKLPLKSDIGALLSHVQKVLAKTSVEIFAVDCPSGVDCLTGEAAPECIPADITICMEAVKVGLLKLPAFSLCGEIEVVRLGLPAGLASYDQVLLEMIDPAWVADRLPARPLNAHKGTFGTAIICAGSVNYSGAALLAGAGAYRIGTGLVEMAVPAPLHAALVGQLPEAVWQLLPHDQGVISSAAARVLQQRFVNADAVLLGPGWGQEKTTMECLRTLLEPVRSNPKARPIGFLQPELSAVSNGKPGGWPKLVVDADALRLLARIPGWWDLLPEETVLTPHPGEMAALTGMSIEAVQQDRIAIARLFAGQWRKVVVLKGAHTVIAEPGGRGLVIPVASPALARAGTGDVLAGMITGLLAQGMSGFEAAGVGAWVHAKAGQMAVKTVGHAAAVLARDVIGELGNVISLLKKN